MGAVNSRICAEDLQHITNPVDKEFVLALLESQVNDALWSPQLGPQRMAYESTADIVGFGGAAGGGKTDLLCGLSLLKHKRILIVRHEKAQTEGIVQRLTEIVGDTDGYNSQKSIWRTSDVLMEFTGVKDPGDEKRWQGRPHDLKAFDEVTEMREAQVRFIMGWNRTNDPGIHAQTIMTFNPPTTTEGRWVLKYFAPWLDDKHPNPAVPGELRWYTTVKGKDIELDDDRDFILMGDTPIYDFDESAYTPEEIIVPKSRTFIPARVTDNVYYMRTGYMSQLQALPEPLRSQMLHGDFAAGIKDDIWQVIPTAWVEAAMVRWEEPKKKPEMLSIGIDVARGGDDNTLIARCHKDLWFDKPLVYPGKDTPDGPTTAGLVIASSRDGAIQHIDVIGVGSSPYDFLNEARQPVVGINAAEKSFATDRSGRLKFFNQRSELYWKMREALDPANNTGIALPPDDQLLADLCAPVWRLQSSVIKVESREDIIKRIGRSPDWASAYILALIPTPKVKHIPGIHTNHLQEYDPYAQVEQPVLAAPDYGPYR